MADSNDTPYDTPIFDDEDEESTQVVSSLDLGGFFGERFRVDERLGIGAMGRVVTALDTKTHQLVALKVLHRERTKSPEFVQRFKREGDVLAGLGHPAIVRLIAFDRAPDGSYWMALEFIDGETLKARIARGTFTPSSAWPIFATLCDAVFSAHRAGVVHRDIKPENLILPKSGAPPLKILDFGLSSSATASVEKLTKKGTLLGTPRYMAPEFLHSASSAGPPADVFSIGAVLFEMLTRQSIYLADDMPTLMGAIFEGRTQKLATVRPDLPPMVGEVIEQATAKNPAERFASVDAFANAYAAAVGASPDRSVFVAPGYGSVELPPRVSVRPPSEIPPSLFSPVSPFAETAAPRRPGLPEMPAFPVGASSSASASVPPAPKSPSVIPPTAMPLAGSASTSQPASASRPGDARVREFTQPVPGAPKPRREDSGSRDRASLESVRPNAVVAVLPYIVLAIFVLFACAGGAFLALELMEAS